jgi:hypothetical protein
MYGQWCLRHESWDIPIHAQNYHFVAQIRGRTFENNCKFFGRFWHQNKNGVVYAPIGVPSVSASIRLPAPELVALYATLNPEAEQGTLKAVQQAGR